MPLLEGKNAIQAVKLREADPQMRGAEIARHLKISRERVRQILTKHSLTNAAMVEVRLCICGKKLPAWRKYCSRACWMKDSRIELVCALCGKHFSIRKSDGRLRKRNMEGFFCNRRCFGRYCGQHYGFQKTKEGITIRWLRRLGFTQYEIIDITGYNYSTVYNVLRVYGGWQTKFKQRTLQHVRVRWLRRLNFLEREIIEMLGCSASTYYRLKY